MTKRYLVAGLALTGGLALASVAAVAAWIARWPETPERCVERFAQLIGNGPDPGAGPFQPVFTYDVTRMDNVLEHFAGDSDKRTGLQMTVSHGASGAALERFYATDVSPKGAIFAADDFTLFRTRGTPGSRAATLAEGCREASPKARLVHVQWIPLPPATDPAAS